MNYGYYGSCLHIEPGTEKSRQDWLGMLAKREGCEYKGYSSPPDEKAKWNACATKALMKWTPTYQARWEAEKEAKKAEAKKGPFGWSIGSMYSCPPPPTPTMQEIQEMKERRVATKTPVLVEAKELSDSLFERMPTWVWIAVGAGITLFLTRRRR